MKTLIVYATKHGATKKCVEMLSHKLKEKLGGEVELHELQKSGVIPIKPYDYVVVGGPVYMGQLDRHVKKFCENNAAAESNAKLGLFISCMTDGEDYAKGFFPEELLEYATVISNFGGELNYDKLGFFHKRIIDMVQKSDMKFTPRGIDSDAIDAFVDKLTEKSNVDKEVDKEEAER